MSRSTKALIWLAVLFVAAFTVHVALADTIYLPMVRNDRTPTPTRTPTGTFTPTPYRGMAIMEIVNSPDGNDVLIERVRIRNISSIPVDMTDWTLRDENQNVYHFPDDYELKIGFDVNVWTQSGIDTLSDLYWGRTEPVWNNFHDCAILRDQEDQLVHRRCY